MRYQYYEELKELARNVRLQYGLEGPRILKSDLKKIFKQNGIKLDYWPHPLKGLRGAYFSDEHGTSIMISKKLPNDPMVFTMAHELKHHLTDRAQGLVGKCLKKESSDPVEIGAEVFAAEFLFPEQLFAQLMDKMDVAMGRCTPEDVVRIKCETKTTLSYTGLIKGRAAVSRKKVRFQRTDGSDWRNKFTGCHFTSNSLLRGKR